MRFRCDFVSLSINSIPPRPTGQKQVNAVKTILSSCVREMLFPLAFTLLSCSKHQSFSITLTNISGLKHVPAERLQLKCGRGNRRYCSLKNGAAGLSTNERFPQRPAGFLPNPNVPRRRRKAPLHLAHPQRRLSFPLLRVFSFKQFTKKQEATESKWTLA